MSNAKKCLLLFFLCAGGLFGIGRLYYRLTDDFRESGIRYNLPFESENTDLIPPVSMQERAQIEEILNQRFTYIGKGAQVYAFLSADGKSVLKFFKCKHFKTGPAVELLPSVYPFKDYKDACIARKKRKFTGVLRSHRIAFTENRETSGLLYVHLTIGQFPGRTVTVIDKLGFEREIDLNRTFFILQKRGETFHDRLYRLLQSGNIEKAKHAIGSILEMYRSDYKKGLFDHDHGVMQNTGFIGEEPFRLDVGKLLKDEKIKENEAEKEDLKQIAWNILRWVEHFFPEYSAEMTDFLEETVCRMTGEAPDLRSLDASDFPRRRLY